MIYPATHNIIILQNSSWNAVFRATNNRQTLSGVTIDAGTPTFSLACHGLSAGNKVVFTGDELPCGITLNVVYYVISAGLTTDAFQVSATEGGSSISASGTASGTFYVAQPLNLTGYTIDADIKQINTTTQVTTFTPVIIDAPNGEFKLSLTPAITEALTPKTYGYDLSLTNLSGERYYWVKGTATVQSTYSRN